MIKLPISEIRKRLRTTLTQKRNAARIRAKGTFLGDGGHSWERIVIIEPLRNGIVDSASPLEEEGKTG